MDETEARVGREGKCWVEGGVQADRILPCGDTRIKKKNLARIKTVTERTNRKSN